MQILCLISSKFIVRTFCLYLVLIVPLSAQDNSETVFSTYFGGIGTDDCDAVAVDRDGNSYLGCHLNSPKIPGSDTHQYSLNTGMDAFVVKLNTSADTVEYITHFGGSGWDAVLDLTVDDAGNIYAVGGTYSADFPVSTNAMQSTFGGVMDVFVAKIDANGQILWTTFFGGNDEEESSDIYLDDSGIVHIVGYTKSTNLVTSVDAVQKQHGGETDAFVASFDLQGRLVYSTYLGGRGEDIGAGIYIDTSGRRYVAGSTNSENFPIVNGLYTNPFGREDAFVAILDSTGSKLEYASYFGGTGADRAIGIGVGPSGDIIFAGGTTSTDLEVVGGIQESNGGRSDIFIAQINIDRQALVYSTYLGGNGTERARKLLVDDMGKAIIVGQTSSANFPVTHDFRNGSNVEDDGFVVVINSLGTNLSYSILSGGSTQDNFEGAAIGWDGSLTVSGISNSVDYPLVSPIQTKFLGGRFDIVVARFLLGLAP